MKETFNTTLHDLLAAINILGKPQEITVSGAAEAIEICPPIRLTAEGRKHFQQALQCNVTTTYTGGEHQETEVCDDDEAFNQMAWTLLSILDRHYYRRTFDKWFDGDDAELI